MTAIRLIAACALAAAIAPCALGAQRTFVSVNGSDSNTCSVGAPCRSFATALTHTDPAGEIIVLESGGYGRVTIAQSVSIEAPSGIYGGISVAGGTNGIDINAPGGTVRLRALMINGQGGTDGINIANAAEVRIDRCRITGMSGHGILVSAAGAVTITQIEVAANGGNGIEANTVVDVSIDGGLVERNAIGVRLTGGVRATMRDVVVRSNSITGLSLVAGPSATPTVVRAERLDIGFNTSSGVFLGAVASGFGSLAIARSVIHENGGNGLFVSAGVGPVDATLSDSVVSGHQAPKPAVAVSGANGTIVASHNVVVDNGDVAFSNTGGVFESAGDNVVRNNNGGGAQTNGTITTFGGI